MGAQLPSLNTLYKKKGTKSNTHKTIGDKLRIKRFLKGDN